MEEITEENFNELVIYNTNIPFILFFSSNTCSYCSVVENILNLFKKKYKNKLNIFKINIKNSNLTKTYNIKGTPTVLIFDESLNLKNRFIGNKITFNILEKELINIVKEEVFFFKFLKLF